MSNVLIGIIGVILFIGLALAGALFLGPRFQESTNNSKASAQIQAMSQIAQAANMYLVQEGTRTDDIGVLVSSKYLKSVPASSTGSAGFIIYDAGSERFVLIGSQPKAVCAAFVRQTAGPTAVLNADFDMKKSATCYGSGDDDYFMALKI
jgi:hypothetical protein